VKTSGRAIALSSGFRAVGLAAALFAAAIPGTASSLEADRPAWPDSYVTRLQAEALLQTLNAELLLGPSATLVLDRWCAEHDLAPAGSKIRADRVRGQDKPAGAEIREWLGIGPAEPVAYRRVRLTCGDAVLSEADNWYVPALLTEAMNRELETTDTSFGRVVKPLGFTRTTIASERLWKPLPDGWEMQPAPAPETAAGALPIPAFVLEHRAVLKLADGQPFSLVVESYTGNILAFPPPAQ